ncbi:MAG: hypothetical protein ACFE7E_03485 [Candidatus Hodarchaeota archaeon]
MKMNEISPIMCHQCGFESPYDAQFCMGCGLHFGETLHPGEVPLGSGKKGELNRREIDKESEILKIARDLGVEEEDVQEVSERSKRISISILSGIFGFVFGFIVGVFLSRESIPSYPYRSGFPAGTIFTKRMYKFISVVLGIIGFFSGLAVSIRIPWGGWGNSFPPSDWGAWYGAFTKRRHSSGLGRKSDERA